MRRFIAGLVVLLCVLLALFIKRPDWVDPLVFDRQASGKIGYIDAVEGAVYIYTADKVFMVLMDKSVVKEYYVNQEIHYYIYKRRLTGRVKVIASPL